MDRRPDRKEHMEKMLVNNIENSVRIQAVDYKNNFIPYNVIGHPRVIPGLIACTCSHIKALTYFFVLKFHILPSPIKPRARWDTWEKSPFDPKVPFSGIKGKISLFESLD